MVASVDHKYLKFIQERSQIGIDAGFSPLWMPDFLFDFQHSLVEWAVRRGRSAIFADCGLGKTPMQLVWAENVVRKTNRRVLIATPIAVGAQAVREAEKFGIEAERVRDGKLPRSAKIAITNYEQLHKYNPDDFAGFVGDESSAIKDFKSERKKIVVEFVRKIMFRLFCTATAAPNDYWELGTTSEALGLLGFRDMITTFFKQELNKDLCGGWGRTKYRFRGHAEQPFWAWVCSFARAVRRPSDLGFDDSRFTLPRLIEREIIVDTATPRPGMLFTMAAQDLREEREERRRTLHERAEKAVEIATSVDGPAVLWCELNEEGDALENLLDDVVQVKGAMSDQEKEEALTAFSIGQVKRLVTKPKIGAWGLNWQHCRNTTVFPSHSFEQYYQLVRRFYRFGQEQDVNVSLILCEGEHGILQSLRRKQEQANRMFDSIVRHMADARSLLSTDYFPEQERIPAWLS